MNSEGKRMVDPYTSSAEEHPMSSFIDDLSPKRTSGSASVQRGVRWHFMACFSERWKRSTMPLLAGWYGYVRVSFTPRSDDKEETKAD